MATLTSSIKGWGEFLAEVTVKKPVTNLRTHAQGIRSLATVKGVFTIVGIGFDIAAIYDAYGRMQDCVDGWQSTEQQIAEYKRLLEALRAAERTKGPVDIIMTVVSEPDNINFKFDLDPAAFRTFDRNLGATRNESEWNFEYLGTLDGGIDGWRQTHTTTYKRNTFVVSLWGNLGSHKIGLVDSDEHYTATSSGKTETEMVNAANEALNWERAVARLIRDAVSILLNAFTIIAGVVGLYTVWTGVGPVLSAAILLALEGAKYVWEKLTSLFDGSELVDSIKRMWPR
jgi:hypothetical protein